MDKLPQQLLVGTDFSVASQSAVDRALQLARGWSARLTLQHVVSSSLWDDVLSTAASAAGVDTLAPAAAEAAAGEALRRRADEIEAASGVRCDVAVSTGRAAGALAHAAERASADLLVIGAHGAHPVRDLVVGTTAQKLLRISPCPVLVVKRKPTAEYRTILAPTDFSPPSRAALQTCLDLLPQATVHVAHAFELPYDGLARYASVDPDTLAHYQREARTRLHETLRHFADEVGVAPGRRVLHVAHGYAPKCIEQWVETTGADLLVIAAHGKSELEATFLGSVSLHTIMAAHCDVLLLRGGATSRAS
jgi:nucleotide-binding universal stress UspA family protein